MIILGVDPGSVITGYAIIKKEKGRKPELTVIDFGCIITDKFLNTGERLKYIYSGIEKVIKKNKPDVMSIETLFFFKNLKTAIPVSQTKGVILLAAQQSKLPVLEFTPLQVKIAVSGYGRAEKKQIQEMVKKIVNLDDFNLKENNRKHDDAFDA